MSYTNAVLEDLDIAPTFPLVWSVVEDGVAVTLDMHDPIDREVNLTRAERILETKMWAAITPH